MKEVLEMGVLVIAISEIVFLFCVLIKNLVDLLGESSDAWYWRGKYLLTLPEEEKDHSDDI